MNGSLTLLDDNLLYIAFSIIGISSKNDQKMKFRGRGGAHCPIRSLSRELFFVTTIEWRKMFFVTARKCFCCNSKAKHEPLCSSAFLTIIIKLHHITLPQVEDKKKRRRPRRSQSERRVRNRTLTERDVKHLERHLSMKRTIR